MCCGGGFGGKGGPTFGDRGARRGRPERGCWGWRGASGGAGGFWDKVEAAREAGCALVVVERPCQETGRSLEELKTDFKEALR